MLAGLSLIIIYNVWVRRLFLVLAVLFLSLSDSLKEKDGSAYRHIEAVQVAQHVDTYMGMGSLTPYGGETRGFCTHHDGCSFGHGGVIVQV